MLKKKESNVDESPGFFADLLENMFFLGVSGVIVMWCTRRKYISFTGRHKKSDHEHYEHYA